MTVITLLDVDAFDKISTEELIYKLDVYRFPPILITLIHSYLTSRTLRVKVNDAL